MDIDVSILLPLCDQALRDQIPRDRILAGKIDPSEIRVWISSKSKEFGRLVEIAGEVEAGLVWTPWVRYSAAELRNLGHFEVWPQRSVPEGDSWEKNQHTFQVSSPIQTLPGLFVRILRGPQVDSIKNLPPNAVGHLGEGWMELIAGDVAAEAIERADLRGYSLCPVSQVKHRGRAFQIVCENFVTHRASRDVSTVGDENSLAGPTSLRRLGSLSYKSGELPIDTDFFRTAEGWNGEQPLWIVSKRVVDCFKTHGLKGLKFRPVLTVGTELHQRYILGFEQLFDRLSQIPKSRLW